LACFKPVGAHIFLQTTRRSMKILPLSCLKFGDMKFFQIIYTVGNKKYGIFTVCR